MLKYFYTPHILVLTEQETKSCLICSLTEMICMISYTPTLILFISISTVGLEAQFSVCWQVTYDTILHFAFNEIDSRHASM